ncbi:LysR family transcriptional regulator [Pseudomonas sp. KNUC1026]|uniref:LysR family transcriptional regulator n=1 Tax=Pseudomonas sp. KNUC1026 TaxID=2893890 RepID=UPI001F3DAC6D|nr:LysR family transcriptional regulator [Pseudomonas sp. KNUC1026]UFH51489.1 LysR family transcriptional regulator [Pseudomonas sp. KNUC1026]
MDRLHAMQVFCRIVECGGFGKAADDLQLPRASVSLAIQQLEAHLKVQLLQRTTRRVRVTEDGAQYYQRCRQLLADLDDLENRLGSGPRGTLRVDMPSAFGCYWIIPKLPDFYRRYPHLRLELGFNDRQVHLQRDGVDCALRAGEVKDPMLAAKPLVKVRQVTCASPAYLARHGVPGSPADLNGGHQMVRFAASDGRDFPLEFEGVEQPVRLPGLLSVDSADAYVKAAQAGFGLIQVPRYNAGAALADGSLVPVLERYPAPDWPLALVYPPHRQGSPRLRAFIDWATQCLREQAADTGLLIAL